MLDWIGLAVLLVSFLIGLARGLVFETLMLAGWITAFVLAQWLAEDVGVWLPMGDAPATWRYAAGFVLVFVAVAFTVGLVASLLRRLVLAAGLRPVDRTSGRGLRAGARGAGIAGRGRGGTCDGLAAGRPVAGVHRRQGSRRGIAGPQACTA